MKKIKKILRHIVYFIVIGCILSFFVRMWIHMDEISNPLETLKIYVAYGRIFFAGILFQSFFVHKEQYRRFSIYIAAEYLIHSITACVVLSWFNLSSFKLITQLLWYILVYVSLPAVLAYLLGRICRRIKNDLLAVGMLILCGGAFLFNAISSLLLPCGFILSDEAYTMISRFFLVFNGSMAKVFPPVNVLSPFSVPRNQLWIIGTWILIFLAVYLTTFEEKSKWQIWFACTCCVMGVFFGVMGTVGKNEYIVCVRDEIDYIKSRFLDSWLSDKEYYAKYPAPVLESADFAVKKYDMDIVAGSRTKFTVTMSISKQDCSQYIFTLYHGYRVKKVTDSNGKTLDFVQDGDYLTIKNDSGKTDALYMEYEGCGLVYMADKDFTYLASGYKYYPVAGKVQVYDVESGNYTREPLKEAADFHVKVSADYVVYSNLDCVNKNEFVGKDTEFFLLGSPFLDTVEYRGIHIVYPAVKYSEEQICKLYDKLIQLFRDNNADLSGKDWFIPSYRISSFNCIYDTDKYMVGDYDEIGLILPQKYGFYNLGVEY